MTKKTSPTISKKNVVAVILGNAVEFFDFSIYVTFTVMIAKVFFPFQSDFVSLMFTLMAFTVGFVVRPFGAIIIGAYADRAGRKPAMLLTLIMMAIGTAGMVILPGYETIGLAAPILLVVIRIIQGIAWGGEAGPATTYILESAPLGKRGTYACWQVVAQGFSAILAGFIGYFLAKILTHDQLTNWGWRIPFIIGLLVLPIGIYVRRHLVETHKDDDQKTSTKTLLKEIFTTYQRPLILGLLILSGSTITQYFLNNMTTFALTELKRPETVSMLATLAGGIGLALGAITGGILSDIFGRKLIIIIPRIIFLIAIIPVFYAIVYTATPTMFFILLVVLSFFHGTSGAALIILLVESFPKKVRATGFSIVYAVGIAFFGGTAQPILTWIVNWTQNPFSQLPYVIIANLVCLCAAWCAKESRPKTD